MLPRYYSKLLPSVHNCLVESNAVVCIHVPLFCNIAEDFEILSNSELLLRENDTTYTRLVSIDIYDNGQYDGELERMFNITMNVLECDFEKWNIVSSPITVSITDDEKAPSNGECV